MTNLLAIPTIVTLGSLNIALLDVIALIAILIALVVGLIQGFAKQALSILGFAAAIILSFAFCGKFAVFINEKVPFITGAIQAWVENTIGVTADAFTNAEALREVLASSKIPAFLHEAIISMVVNANFEISIIETITGWIINVVSFVVLMVLFLILFAIIKGVVKKIVELPIIKTVDKALGVVFSIGKCLVIMLLVLSIASMIIPLNDYLQPDGVTCYLNSALQGITNSQFFKNILEKLIQVNI